MWKTSSKIIVVNLLFFSTITWSQQDRKLIAFKVSTSDTVAVGNINVINLVTEQTTVTDVDGSFSILAKAEDLLVLSAASFEYKRKIIDETDLKADIVEIVMVPIANQLDEVVINEYGHITTRTLGIVSPDVKIYTQAERKLYAAQSGGPISSLINALTGETARLKEQLKISKKEILLDKLKYYYADNYYTESLKIPEDKIGDFRYYLIEDVAFLSAMKAKNKTLSMFHATQLAEKYLNAAKEPQPAND